MTAAEEEELTNLRCLPLVLNGRSLAGGMLSAFIVSKLRSKDMTGDLARFLNEWQSSSALLEVFTSGSTSAPKKLLVEKIRMAKSAHATCTFLGLQPGDSALLAMPLRYIAGKMVVVRALVQHLNLVAVTPSSSPLTSVGQPLDFAALTPMQAFESLQKTETGKRLRDIRHLLLGGGPVQPELAAQLADFPNAVWSSYGMTETLSHVALRRLNGPKASEWYTPMPGVSLSLSATGTLVVSAPEVCAAPLVTNDIVELNREGGFRILGRKDNVIDSGGIKIQAEEVETKLDGALGSDFCITSVPDARLGEKIVLLHTQQTQDEDLNVICRRLLPPYWVPRAFLHVPAIPKTGTGKIAREQAKKLARSLLMK